MTPFIFIVASLACYRGTVLLSRDLCPWKACQRLRKLYPTWIGCPYCISITVALLIELALYWVGFKDSLPVCACLILAMSAIAIALDRVFTADHNPDKNKK